MKNHKIVYPELDYMNALASILVILIHVLSLGISKVESTSWQAAVIYFPWRLSAFVVPMFLYTGAVKMAQQFKDTKITFKKYLRYFIRRIVKIYLPYVLWVCIYYVSFLKIGYVRGEFKEFFDYLFIGNLASPFYYIIIIMQFYLLMPLWMWMLRHIPAYISVGIGLLCTFCMQRCADIFAMFGIDFPYADRVFPTYLIFWVVGLYVGAHYEEFIETLRKKKSGLGICGIVIILCAFFAYIQYSRQIYLFNMNDVKMVADLLSIFMIHTLCLRLTKATPFTQNLLQKLYGSSFFIYLSHCLFLTLAANDMQLAGISDLTVLLILRFIVCYTIPFLLYYLYNKFLSVIHSKFRPLG